MVELSQKKALIFRITHIENVPMIIQEGQLYCRNTCPAGVTYREIGNQDLIAKRKERPVLIHPHGTLSDYIPFYFTPFSPMLYNIRTGRGVPQRPMEDIAIIVSSLRLLVTHEVPFVFTDRHAKLETAAFSSELDDLSWIPWKLLQNRDFQRDPNRPEKMERYQAEALVHQCLPVDALHAVACYSAAQGKKLQAVANKHGSNLQIAVKPGLYFS